MNKKPLTLPINDVLSDICRVLEHRDELVLQAPPGAGKTTAVPLALLDAPWRNQRKILLLEPRRIAARSAAARMAELLGEVLGERVGYRIRMEVCVSEATVIEVITEGLLIQILQSDPALSDVAAIIFDEFHERSIHSDLGLTLSLQARALFRESQPLKLVVMSATLDGDAVAKYLDNAPLLRSEGRSYPVDIHYGTGVKAGESPVPATVHWVRQALREHPGDVLVFLPGQREIEAAQAMLKHDLPQDTQVFPLFGNLSFERQRQAIEPLPKGRKVVLATDIAETSLTIEGVSVVVDSGLCRRAVFDARNGLTRLHTQRVSKASAVQRAGRAGRLGPGHCYRVWRRGEQAQLAEFSQPEIREADMAPLLLALLRWGVNHPDELSWLDKPNGGAVQQGFELLTRLGLLQNSLGQTAAPARLTDYGMQLAQHPLHPRLSHMLQSSVALNCSALASLLAALLIEKSPPLDGGASLSGKLQVLVGERICPKSHQAWRARCLQQGKRYCRRFTSASDFERAVRHSGRAAVDMQQAAQLLALAFPDRIAKRRDATRHIYLLSNGRSAKLSQDDALAGEAYLVVSEVGGFAGQAEDKIFSALPLAESAFSGPLQSLTEQRQCTMWRGDKLQVEHQQCLGALVLKRRSLRDVSEQAYCSAIIERLQREGLSALPWTDALRQWQQRVALLRRCFPGDAWPDLSDAQLLASLDEWLAPYLVGLRTWSHLKQLALDSIVQNLLAWPLRRRLDELAPSHITVPSGSCLGIDYLASPPVLKVKLQEMFGCKSTPSIAGGQVRLLVHLLSPARRPLQITQDLEGFWNNSYQEVKKEMKGRYPKHPWPDNPWQQAPTAKVKKRL